MQPSCVALALSIPAVLPCPHVCMLVSVAPAPLRGQRPLWRPLPSAAGPCQAYLHLTKVSYFKCLTRKTLNPTSTRLRLLFHASSPFAVTSSLRCPSFNPPIMPSLSPRSVLEYALI